MTTVLIGVLVVSAMVVVALRADTRLRSEDRLPVRWLLPNEVVASAPRVLALAFPPALAFLTFAGLAVLSGYTRPRPGQEGLLVPVLLVVGLGFVAAQRFHLWMIDRTLRRDGR